MKPDDLEQQLQRQPLRSIPEHWRSEILNAPRRAHHPPPTTHHPQPANTWRELLWPCPQAWAGLAAVWLAVLLLNLASREPGRVAQTSKREPAPEFFIALREHRRLLAELIGTPLLVERKKPFEPRPRSELSLPFLTA